MSNVFTLLDHIKNQIHAGGLVVETGTARDGSSTNYLHQLAKDTGNSFITVDVSPILTGGKISTSTMLAEIWAMDQLPLLGKKVTLAYLDSGDWIKNPGAVRMGTADSDTVNLIADYANKGMSLDNISASVSITKQALGMLKFLHEKSVVVLADTSFNSNTDTFAGKGMGAAYLLLAQGFKMVGASPRAACIILGREIQPVESLTNLDVKSLSKKYEGPKIKMDHIVYQNL